MGHHHNVPSLSDPVDQVDQHVAHDPPVFQAPSFQDLLLLEGQAARIRGIRHRAAELALELLETTLAVAQAGLGGRVRVVRRGRVRVEPVDGVVRHQLLDESDDGVPIR